jgi:hypothetical protein
MRPDHPANKPAGAEGDVRGCTGELALLCLLMHPAALQGEAGARGSPSCTHQPTPALHCRGCGTPLRNNSLSAYLPPSAALLRSLTHHPHPNVPLSLSLAPLPNAQPSPSLMVQTLLCTCIRRACPTHGCGTSPSPAISLDVSTMSTLHRSASTRAASRTTVVFPLQRTRGRGVRGSVGKGCQG